VRVGQYVAVAGSAAVAEDGSVIGVGDPFRQAQHCIEIIAEALKATGAGLENVVRTRIFVTDISHRPEMPATSMVEVARLIDPAMLVEIEADAVLVND
jgi:enamine deaminase RidA (YjgF/YER057c/UK114 family)